MEFIETEEHRLLRDPVGERRNRVRPLRIRALPVEDPLMRFLHEGMEMDAATARNLGGCEKQIHQHGFPAPDLAHQI
jgi:hypothetical protein